MMLEVSLSKSDWMDISQLLESISVKALRDVNLSPDSEVYFSRIFYASHSIRLEVLKSFDSYVLIRKELENINLDDLNLSK